MHRYLNKLKSILQETATPTDLASTYQEKLSREGKKWGQQSIDEKAERWISWLHHPLILNHYQKLGMIEGETWEQWVKKALGGPAERSIELGCGPAVGSRRIFEAGSSKYLEGFDISEEAVELGESTFASIGAQGKILVGDVNTIQLPKSTYDLVFSCHSFHHFVELEYIMDQVHQSLTPHGLFVLDEYVGPTQFQWTEKQLGLVNSLLALLPDRLRALPWNARKDAEPRMPPEQVIAVSPFESIRSSEIYELFKERFQVVAAKSLGGTIQHLLYNNIIHNFHEDDPEAVRYIQCVITIEDELIAAGLLPSDFMILIGKRKDT